MANEPLTLDTILLPETTFRSGIRLILEKDIAAAERQLAFLPPFNRITITLGPHSVDIEAWMAKQVLGEIQPLLPRIDVPLGKSLDLLDEVMTPITTYRDTIHSHLDLNPDLADTLLRDNTDYSIRMDGVTHPVPREIAKAAALEWFSKQIANLEAKMAAIQDKIDKAKQ